VRSLPLWCAGRPAALNPLRPPRRNRDETGCCCSPRS
jgi:hypothetical protein